MANTGRCIMIVNPASGTVSKHRIIPHICKRLDRSGIDYTIKSTRYPGHAKILARQAADDGYDTVIAVGGDGTVNETASGLVGTSTALAIIPTGSGNGLARHLGIPVDIDSAIRVMAKGNIIDADYGTANDKPFFCTFGVGFDAAVSERCARQKRRGILMYLKNTINEYMKFSPEEYTIEANGQKITDRAFLIVVCNARRTDSGAAHIDGDAIEMPPLIDIKCHPGKLKVFAPTKSTRFIPFVTPTVLFFRDILLSVRHLLPNAK